MGTTLPSQTLEKGYPLDNLIEAVNIVGSLFYSSILGIFVVAFFLKRAGGNAVFAAALTAEALVLTLYATTDIGFLWFHAIGCIVVYVLAAIFSSFPAARQSTTRSVG